MRYPDNVKVTVEWGDKPDEVFELVVPAHVFSKGQGGYRLAEELKFGGETYRATLQFADQHKDPTLVAAAQEVVEAKALQAERIMTDRILATLAKVGALRKATE